VKIVATISFVVLLACSVQAQQPVLVNMGATITVTGGGLLYVSGGTELRAGRVDAMDLSRVTFHGPVSIYTGGLYLFKDATGLITGDLDIKLDGICWRYRPGVLTVEGTIYNDGELNNEGEVIIGKP
jgi:hypothetical protein